MLAMSSMAVNQQYILNMVSLNRTTHKTKLHINLAVENVLTRGLEESYSVFPLEAVALIIYRFSICCDFMRHNCGEYQELTILPNGVFQW